MIFTIKNEHLNVDINSRGAEIWSIKDADNTEFLWQGNKEYWEDRSPILFPYIARLTDGKYTYNDKTYEMSIHGFANYTEFYEISSRESEILLKMNCHDKESYPFDFDFYVHYELLEKTLKTTFKIENKNDIPMYFGLGGHSGFNVPFVENTDFSDYYLEFYEKSPKQINMSDDCFVLDGCKNLNLSGDILKLSHDLFDNDAIILKDMGKKIALKSKKTKKYIELSFDDMDYLGLWHKVKSDAPYICIEPWTSLPSRKGVIEDLETQANLIKLNKGQYINTIKMTFSEVL